MSDVRIGVFVCRCGTNIGGFLDVPALVAYARQLPNVVFAQENLYTCSEAGLTAIKTAIAEQRLNRVIVASCTPRTHEPLFRATCQEAGLNPYLFEFVNIREQCSWVHMREPDRATAKAQDLIRMGVARARLLEPQEGLEVEVIPAALVIGGGVAGMTCALNLAHRGFEVTLVEREPQLGGLVRDLYQLSPTREDASQRIDTMIDEVENHRNIEVLTAATVVDVTGFVGNYDVTVRQGGQNIPYRAGVIVVATGAQTYTPVGLYGYDGRSVVTQLELEQRLRDEAFAPDRVVMIQCVGARTAERPYCSRVCCATALHNALILRERNPEAQIYILYRDMQAYGTLYEDLYREARERGIIFVHYTPDQPPRVGEGVVEVVDTFLGDTVHLPYNLVVLSTPMVAHPDAGEVAKLLKVPVDEHGFFLEAHVKLRPLDFATDGVYVCGAAHWPATVSESIAQAYGAASRASVPLARGRVIAEPIVSVVDEEKCIGCRNCEVVCEYGAIKVVNEHAEANPVLCKGCGTCAVECPAMAITMRHFTDDQLSSIVRTALANRKQQTLETEGPQVLAFFCNWCAYAGADLAGVSRFQYPPTAKIIRVMCTGRIDEKHVLLAFLLGADGVLIGGCHPGTCHYISGNLKAEKRIRRVRRWLKEAGLEPERLRLEWVSAGEGTKLAEIMKDFSSQLMTLGPSPLRPILLSASDDTEKQD